MPGGVHLVVAWWPCENGIGCSCRKHTASLSLALVAKHKSSRYPFSLMVMYRFILIFYSKISASAAYLAVRGFMN